MTPETSRFLQTAADQLERGARMLGALLQEDAGRAAYLAVFHAAQAVIFERSGKIVKTHRGVQSEFLRLTKDDPAFTPDQRSFLSRAYEFKAVADYDTGSIAKVTSQEAATGIEAARMFVAAVHRALKPEP